jgi:hypothetical protein
VRLDDAWFHKNRKLVLDSYLHDPQARLSQSSRVVRALARNDTWKFEMAKLRDASERALGKLARRHEISVRHHMQFFASCLTSVGLIPVEALVHATVAVEWLWYQTTFKPFYRDHLAHVLKVGTTAVGLLRDPSLPGGPLVDKVAEGLAKGVLGTLPALRQTARRLGITEEELGKEEFWKGIVLEATRIGGLLHDLAYPADLAWKLEHHAEPTMLGQGPPGEAAVDQWLIDGIGTHLVAAVFSRGKLPERGRLTGEDAQMARKMLHKSHSVMAAVRLLQFVKQADELWRLHPHALFAMEWAALAAAMHDLDKMMELHNEPWLQNGENLQAVRPSYRRDPVSYLVALADQLQDWGRFQYTLSRGDDGRHCHLDLAHSATPVPAVLHNGRLSFELPGLSWEASCFVVTRPVDAVELTATNSGLNLIWHYPKGTEARWPAKKVVGMTKTLGDGVWGGWENETRGWMEHEGLFEKVNITTQIRS